MAACYRVELEVPGSSERIPLLDFETAEGARSWALVIMDLWRHVGMRVDCTGVAEDRAGLFVAQVRVRAL